MDKSVSIIIPAYNEEKTLINAVNSAFIALERNNMGDFEIIIFNDASTDKTGEIADELAEKYAQVKAIHNPQNMNLGYNITRGFQLAAKEYVGNIPGNNDVSAESLEKILSALGKTDVIISYIANQNERPRIRRFISETYVGILNVAFGLNMRYYNGVCFFRTAMIKKISVSTFGFAYMSEILIKLLKSGAGFVEVPMICRADGGGTSAFRIKNVLSVLKTFLTLFWEVRVLKKRVDLT